MLAVGASVFVLPEQAPEAKLTYPAYGIIKSLTRKFVSVRTTADSMNDAPSTFKLTRPLDPTAFKLAIVSEDEAHGGLGLWLRRHVACLSNGRWLHGQVIAFNTSDSLISVKTLGKVVRVACTPATVVATFPVCAALLFQSSWPAEGPDAIDQSFVHQAHSTILQAVLGMDDDQETSRSIPEILQRVPGATTPNGDFMLEVVEPTTGQGRAATLQHIVDYAFFIDADRPPPRDVILGSCFSDDPRMHPGTQLDDSDSDSGSETSAPEPLTQPRYVPPRLPVPGPRQHPSRGARQHPALDPPRPREIDNFLNQEYASSESSDHSTPTMLAPLCAPPSVVDNHGGFPANNRDTLPEAGEAAVFRSVQGAMRLASAAKSLPEYMAQFQALPKAANPMQFAPTQVEAHWWICSPRWQSVMPLEFLSAAQSAKIYLFIPHPGIFTCLFDFRFGSGLLSLDHFLPIDLHQRNTWNDKLRLATNHFPKSLTPPSPRRRCNSMSDVCEAIKGVSVFANAFGSPSLLRFVSAAESFASHFRYNQELMASDVDQVVLWLNQRFEEFGHALLADVQHCTGIVRHLQCEHSFLPSNKPHDELLHSILLARTKVSRAVSAMSPSDEQPPQRKKLRPTMSHDVMKAIPVVDGLPCCLRWLSQRGCSKADDGGICTGHGQQRRRHVFPTSLPAVVRAHLTEHFGGVRSGGPTRGSRQEPSA